MIKMLTSIGGERFSVAANQVTDRFSPAEERRLIDAGLAEASDEIVLDHAIEVAPMVEMHANDVATVHIDAPAAPAAAVPVPAPSAPAAPSPAADAKAAPRKARS